MQKNTFIYLFALLLFVSCKKKDAQLAGDDLSVAKTTLNVSYGSDPRNIMDVYLPTNRSTATTPVMILIHGGGWVEGSKNDLDGYLEVLKRNGPEYAVFNINYRLAGNGQNLFPAQELDVKKCIEFIYSKRSEYNISDKFVLLGASAGGHLALLHAYKYTTPVKVKAVVSFFGPTDLTAFYNNPPNIFIPITLQNVTGTTPLLNPLLYQNSSSVSFVSTTSCPTLLLQGGNDPLVPASQAELLKAKLAAAGVPHQYVLYPTGGHGDWDAATYADAFIKIDAFLSIHNP
jgi:acetyl esterase/lipase